MDTAYRDLTTNDIWVRQDRMFYPFMNASVGGMRLKDEEAHARLKLVKLVEEPVEPDPWPGWTLYPMQNLYCRSKGEHVTAFMYPDRDRLAQGRHILEANILSSSGRLPYGYYREGPTGSWYNRGNGNRLSISAVLSRVHVALGEPVPEWLERWIRGDDES